MAVWSEIMDSNLQIGSIYMSRFLHIGLLLLGALVSVSAAEDWNTTWSRLVNYMYNADVIIT